MGTSNSARGCDMQRIKRRRRSGDGGERSSLENSGDVYTSTATADADCAEIGLVAIGSLPLIIRTLHITTVVMQVLFIGQHTSRKHLKAALSSSVRLLLTSYS